MYVSVTHLCAVTVRCVQHKWSKVDKVHYMEFYKTITEKQNQLLMNWRLKLAIVVWDKQMLGSAERKWINLN